MLLLLLGCQVHEAIHLEEPDPFLMDVTNQWWHLQDQDFNIYLEQQDELDSTGDVWVDFVNGPETPIEANIWDGTWNYLGDQKFLINYESDSYTLSTETLSDGCYTVSFRGFLSDVACKYTE